MKRLFSNTAILVFFCIMMGGIIMLDCIIAVGQTKQIRGVAEHFSDFIVRFSVLQADIPEAFTQADLLSFIEEQAPQIRSLASINTSKQGAELYSSISDCFSQVPAGAYGVWLREDTYQEWMDSGESGFFYKNHWYTVLGSYTADQIPESFLLDIRGELIQSPDTAMNGTFYLDGGEQTLALYQSLAARIQETYPYAQVVLIEDQANGYTLSRIRESESALYYFLQMGLLVFLNLLNFGNISGYWVQTREREIFVRRMVGGTSFTVYRHLLFPFSAVTAASIGAGMAIGFAVGAVLSVITLESLKIGLTIGALQWIVLLLFGSCVLVRRIRLPMMRLKKSET